MQLNIQHSTFNIQNTALNGYLLILPQKFNTQHSTLMKKELIKKILNFVVTVMTAAISTFCITSCQG